VINDDPNLKFESLIGLRTTQQHGIVDFNKIIIHDEDFLKNTDLKYTYNLIIDKLFQGELYEIKNEWARKLYESTNPTSLAQFETIIKPVLKYKDIDPWDITTLITLLIK